MLYGMSTTTEKVMNSVMWLLRLPPKMIVSGKITRFVTVELVEIIATLLRDY
jgi:hypothetical protein